jgi:cyclic nucleotide gated channel alpha 1
MAEIEPENSWLSKMHFDNLPWYEQYVWGYYWGTTVMLTVGFGDITPANFKEAIIVVII